MSWYHIYAIICWHLYITCWYHLIICWCRDITCFKIWYHMLTSCHVLISLDNMLMSWHSMLISLDNMLMKMSVSYMSMYVMLGVMSWNYTMCSCECVCMYFDHVTTLVTNERHQYLRSWSSIINHVMAVWACLTLMIISCHLRVQLWRSAIISRI